MQIIRWHSYLAAMIFSFGATPLRSQSPLERLENILLEKEKAVAPETNKTNDLTPESAERLPIPSSTSRSLLVPAPESIPSPAENLPRETLAKEPREPAYLGMTLERPIGGGPGLKVVEVVAQSPAWKSGFRVGDRVVAIGGNAVSDIDGFAAEMERRVPNELVKFLIDRQGKQIEVNVVLIAKSLAAKTLPQASIPVDAPPLDSMVKTPAEMPLPLASNVPPDMLTPQYVRQLLAELADLRAELNRSQARIRALERQIQESK